MTHTHRIETPQGPDAPLIFDSPHSGSIYPDDFDHIIDRMTLRRSEDAHIDELFSGVTTHGASLLHALFPRCYIDPNRNEDDIDTAMIADPWPYPVNPTSKTLERGVGLIWKDMKAFGPIYGRPLSAAEVASRIETFWRPYHDALAGLMETARTRHGKVIHVNCHSMASMGDRTTEDGMVVRPDFVIGDRDGSTCAPEVTHTVATFFKERGYSVAINDPYKGFELVRRHGNPGRGSHSIQIEINRALYMNEATLCKRPGYLRLQQELTDLAADLAALARVL
ncbi:hydrolase [Roseibium aquae]|uniref:Hydrolase n=1 Tax=Roseibium aquae TaxID=1323746 RepID=A0A916TFV0_9HYPH|nr:N-formylglutamate amidohydrolase [Roseibium aquae]GGB43505.1 hydrolase [Roseibium aquae]